MTACPSCCARSSTLSWLNPANDDVGALGQTVTTGTVQEFRYYPVSTYVNNPRNEGKECIEPQAAGPEPSKDFELTG